MDAVVAGAAVLAVGAVGAVVRGAAVRLPPSQYRRTVLVHEINLFEISYNIYLESIIWDETGSAGVAPSLLQLVRSPEGVNSCLISCASFSSACSSEPKPRHKRRTLTEGTVQSCEPPAAPKLRVRCVCTLPMTFRRVATLTHHPGPPDPPGPGPQT